MRTRGGADWAQPPLLKILAVGRLVVIVAVKATFPVLEDVGLTFACGGTWALERVQTPVKR